MVFFKPPTFSTALMASWPTPELSQVAATESDAWWKLIAGWWYTIIPTPLKNMKVSWVYYFKYMGKKNVPNHQPDSDTWWKYVDLISMDINSDHGFIMVIMGASPVTCKIFGIPWGDRFMPKTSWLWQVDSKPCWAKVSRWHLRINKPWFIN